MNRKLVLGFDLVLLGLLILVFWTLFGPHYVFLPTQVAGGDMVSHPWIARSLKSLWSGGRFWGWNPGWFGGFPFLYFYFSPIYALTIVLEKLGFPETVAFKLMVWGVVFAVPIVTFLSGRKWLTTPLAFCFAALNCAVFLNEFLMRSGGNMKGVLTGQVSYEFGLLCVVGFCGYLFRGQANRVGAASFFALAVLSHVYSGMLAFAFWICFSGADSLAYGGFRERVRIHLGPLFAIGATSFFWGPFLYYRSFVVTPIDRSSLTWAQLGEGLQIHQTLFEVIYLGALVSVGLCAMRRKKDWILVLAIGALVLLLVGTLPFLRGTPFLHYRIPPLIYLSSIIAFFLALRSLEISEKWQWPVFGVLGLMVLQSPLPSDRLDQVMPRFLRSPVKDSPLWWRWNMSGLEAKPMFRDVEGVWKYLAKLPPSDGRVAVEDFDYQPFGSPRVFELTPFAAGKPTIEGLLLESSVTYPAYHYISHYFTPAAWWPGFSVRLPEFEPGTGVRHFSLLNVKTFIAHRARTIAELDRQGFRGEYQNPSFKIYSVNSGSRIASRIEGEVPVIESPEPLMESVLSLPRSLETRVEIRKGSSHLLNKVPPEWPRVAQSLVPLDGEWSSDGQGFRVAATGASTGQPKSIFLKIPYFPNWKSDSGESVRLVSPNLILVRTERSELSLHFEAGGIEHFTFTVSVIFLIGGLAGSWFGRRPSLRPRARAVR